MSFLGCWVVSHAAPMVPLACASVISGVICASTAYALASGMSSMAFDTGVLVPGRISPQRSGLLTPNGE